MLEVQYVKGLELCSCHCWPYRVQPPCGIKGRCSLLVSTRLSCLGKGCMFCHAADCLTKVTDMDLKGREGSICSLITPALLQEGSFAAVVRLDIGRFLKSRNGLVSRQSVWDTSRVCSPGTLWTGCIAKDGFPARCMLNKCCGAMAFRLQTVPKVGWINWMGHLTVMLTFSRLITLSL